LFRFFALSLIYLILIFIALPLWLEALLTHNHQELWWASVVIIAGLLSLPFEWQRAKKVGIIGWRPR